MFNELKAGNGIIIWKLFDKVDELKYPNIIYGYIMYGVIFFVTKVCIVSYDLQISRQKCKVAFPGQVPFFQLHLCN